MLLVLSLFVRYDFCCNLRRAGSFLWKSGAEPTRLSFVPCRFGKTYRNSPVTRIVLPYYVAMKRWICVAMLGALSPQFLGASDTAKQQEAITRLEQAVSKTNIFELPSFAMQADVHIKEDGKVIDGTYQLLWNGPNQWREGISLPGYSEVQIGGKGVIWVQRSTDYIPVAIYDLHQALGFGSSAGSTPAISLMRLALTTKDTIKKTRERKDHGDKLTCFEIEGELKHTSEICVRDNSGTLARDSSTYSDENLQPVGGKVFPGMVGARLDKTDIRVRISEISTPVQFPSGTFAAPAGIASQPGCMNPTPARLTAKEMPLYPLGAKAQHQQGTVDTDVLIGTDGVPQIRKVVESPGPELATSSLIAIKQWRYEPAMCDGQPVVQETIITVNYMLSSN